MRVAAAGKAGRKKILATDGRDVSVGKAYKA
jgi:hypothetical protein